MECFLYLLLRKTSYFFHRDFFMRLFPNFPSVLDHGSVCMSFFYRNDEIIHWNQGIFREVKNIIFIVEFKFCIFNILQKTAKQYKHEAIVDVCFYPEKAYVPMKFSRRSPLTGLMIKIHRNKNCTVTQRSTVRSVALGYSVPTQCSAQDCSTEST